MEDLVDIFNRTERYDLPKNKYFNDIVEKIIDKIEYEEALDMDDWDFEWNSIKHRRPVY